MNKTYSAFLSIIFVSACGGGGGGGGGGGSTPPPPTTPPPSVSISSDITSGSTGDSITITWSSSNSNSCSASGAWGGSKSTSGTETVPLSAAGNNTFNLTCTGSGGSSTQSVVIFAFDLGLKTDPISTDEDTVFTGSIKANPNQTLTTPLQYTITESPQKGLLDLSAEAEITYTPYANLNGADSFTYEVYSVDKDMTKTVNITIDIISVNDPPVMTFETAPELSRDTMVFDNTVNFRVNVSDVDNTIEELQFLSTIDGNNTPISFTADEGENPNGAGTLVMDVSVAIGGLFDTELTVADNEDVSTLTFETWYVGSREVVTIQQDDDPEDGFDGGAKTPKDYNVYYLIGGKGEFETIGQTKYLFIGDSLNGQTDIDLYRRALIASINKVRDSDSGEFFKEDYFTVVSAEPVDPDGTSATGIRTGCYDFDDSVYCIGDMDTAIFDVFLPDNTLVSTLTRVQGRGVNLGNRNIQRIRENDPERTSNTLMHELGHAHGFMGDEYRSSDDRDVSAYADLNINTSTQSTATLVKWNHHFEDNFNILGRDILVCYNYADGTIADRDDQGIVVEDCGCFANEWDESGNFIRKNPECNKVGHFEGNYYGLYDNYRPNYCNIMDSCSSGGYGAVNSEGFAVGSLQNQGFYDPGNASTITNDQGQVTGWRISLDVQYNPEKVSVKWFVNGVEDTSKENQLSVTFNRPSDNSIQIYTYKGVDLSGTIIAEDDPLDKWDFYRGLMQSDWYWIDENGNSTRDPVDAVREEYQYGYMYGPVGGSWGVNWARW